MSLSSYLAGLPAEPAVAEETAVPGLKFAPQLHCSCGAALQIAGYHEKAGITGGKGLPQEYTCHHCGAAVRPQKE